VFCPSLLTSIQVKSSTFTRNALFISYNLLTIVIQKSCYYRVILGKDYQDGPGCFNTS